MPTSPTPSPRPSVVRLGLAVLLVGVSAGLGGAALTAALHGVERLVYGRGERSGQVLTAGLDPARGAVAVLLASLVLALAWWALRRWGRALVDVGPAVAGGRPPAWETVANSLFQTLGVAAGLPVGREAAPRELAAMLATRVEARLRLGPDDRAVLVAAAAGGALGAVYQVPLAGAVYAVELILRRVTPRVAAICLAVSVIATAVARVVVSPLPQFRTASVDSTDLAVLAWAVVLGLLLGPLGGWFGDLSALVRRSSQRGAWTLVTLPAAGALTAAAAWVQPLVLGNGRAAAQSAYLGMGLTAAALALAVKVSATLLMLRAGAVGGTLAPAIAAGALAATVVGHLALLGIPAVALPVVVLAPLGAAAVLATSLRAPVSGLLLVVGTAGLGQEALLAMGLAVSAAMATASVRPVPRRRGRGRSDH